MSELNVTESSWIHFKLHWIKVSGCKCDSVCAESQTTLYWWHRPRSVAPTNFGDHIWLMQEVMAMPQPKLPSPWVWLLVYLCIMHSSVCSHVRLHSHVYVFFPLRAISEGQILGQTWADGFDTKCAWFVFIKIKFCCKNAHAEMLHLHGYPAVVEPSPDFLVRKSWERDLKFVEIVLGFTM